LDLLAVSLFSRSLDADVFSWAMALVKGSASQSAASDSPIVSKRDLYRVFKYLIMDHASTDLLDVFSI
jgi:hypothetical protein